MIACFNTKTGDVEDSPAPLALNKFNVIEKDGGVYITGKEADIKGGKRQVNVKTTPSTDEKVVIVGGLVASCTFQHMNIDEIAGAQAHSVQS